MLTFKIGLNIELDKRSFFNYLFNEDYLYKRGHVRKSIIRNYNSLAKEFENNISESDGIILINNFIEKKYLDYNSKLEEIIVKWGNLFDGNSEIIIEGFKDTMDYEIINEKINLYPSFLPASTFGDNVIRFSVVSEVFKNQDQPYLDIFLHEYIHIIWQRQIINIYNELGALNPISHDYLKELVAPVIIRNSYWDKIRQSNQHKFANQRQQLLNISSEGIDYNITDFFENIYNNLRADGKSFSDISKEYIKIFQKIENQIIEKHNIFSKFGYNPNDKDNSLKILRGNGYFIPINFN